MTLESNNYTALGKTSSGEIRIKFVLHTIPVEKWTRAFNRYNSHIVSILGSKSIIVTGFIQQLAGKDVALVVAEYIQQADEELANRVLRENVLKTALTSGYVIVHDGLSYTVPQSGKSEYQLYLEAVQARRIVL